MYRSIRVGCAVLSVTEDQFAGPRLPSGLPLGSYIKRARSIVVRRCCK